MSSRTRAGITPSRRIVWNVIVLASCASAIGSAQSAGSTGCGFGAANAATGADVPTTYFGPPPSTVQKELVGPLQLLTAGKLDEKAATITLPLYKGKVRQGNQTVWYVLTDTTDRENAAALGLNFSAKLFYAATSSRAVRTATLQKDNTLLFEAGTVDFSPEHMVTPTPGPSPFPPSVAKAGSVGDSNYSPLVRITNAGGHIYNAPIIAMGDNVQDFADGAGKPNYRLVHGKVLSINISQTNDFASTVTLGLTTGFSFAKPVLYLSTDASAEITAALEGATLIGSYESFSCRVRKTNEVSHRTFD